MAPRGALWSVRPARSVLRKEPCRGVRTRRQADARRSFVPASYKKLIKGRREGLLILPSDLLVSLGHADYFRRQPGMATGTLIGRLL